MSKALTTHWQPPTLGDVAAGGAEQVPDGPLAPEGVQVGRQCQRTGPGNEIDL